MEIQRIRYAATETLRPTVRCGKELADRALSSTPARDGPRQLKTRRLKSRGVALSTLHWVIAFLSTGRRNWSVKRTADIATIHHG